MESDDAPEWEKSKENVRPLRSGRMVESLSKGLAARENDSLFAKLNTEKEKFELALRSYEGDDPLVVWYDYILWTEQNLPSDNAKLSDLLYKGVEKFRYEDKYKNDERYILMWVKYAGRYKQSLEAFKYMHSKSIGAKCASFYIAWAELLEYTHDSKTANSVLDLGIEKAAEPVSKLKEFQSEFQTRACRTTFDKFKAECSRDRSSSSGHSKPATVSQPQAAAFAIHAGSEATPSKSVGPVNFQLGLSVKKATAPDKQAVNPVFMKPAEDTDAQDYPVYCKDKVYGGIVEYSFEELRAIKMRKKQEKENARTELGTDDAPE